MLRNVYTALSKQLLRALSSLRQVDLSTPKDHLLCCYWPFYWYAQSKGNHSLSGGYLFIWQHLQGQGNDLKTDRRAGGRRRERGERKIEKEEREKQAEVCMGGHTVVSSRLVKRQLTSRARDQGFCPTLPLTSYVILGKFFIRKMSMMIITIL